MFAEGSPLERHTLVLDKRSIFCEVFAEGSLPERHTLVLEKDTFSVRGLPKAACRSVTPRFESEKTSFSQNGNLRFLTHDRDLGAKIRGK